jgi:hypothetical protein
MVVVMSHGPCGELPNEVVIEQFDRFRERPLRRPHRIAYTLARGERWELVAGTRKLQELREAIRGVPAGQGDFALGPEKGSLELTRRDVAVDLVDAQS